ncbi:PHD and RING finger domain-containing protein 1-like isoform X2 [Anabas testudineus]|uniref:PHD and RING finger domain-containing protein 1-like isoform X2 n=1 Tax=Anabas testudineus TaxID=64144 RepID=UPI000E46486A|nr:PHD and RING finger domain-containing protein 1-like isoform X2 [Anabas testudineus]
MEAAGREGAHSDKCYICLGPFDKQTVASLESCQHVFCLECILQWSQASNTCPVDRISFSVIHQRRCPGGDVEKKIKVSPPKKNADDGEEETDDAVVCEQCGRSDGRHQLLLCVHCDSGYHMDCLTPSLNTGPEGDWICPDCVSSPHHSDVSMAEEEISDGELMDLLTEANATASTSSRFRPSTVNRASSSTERRRSARMWARTSSNLNLRSRASWHVPKYLLRATTDEQIVNHRSDSSSATT